MCQIISRQFGSKCSKCRICQTRGIPIIYLRSHATDAGYGLPGDVFDDFDLQAVAAASIAQAQSEPLRLRFVFLGGKHIEIGKIRGINPSKSIGDIPSIL